MIAGGGAVFFLEKASCLVVVFLVVLVLVVIFRLKLLLLLLSFNYNFCNLKVWIGISDLLLGHLGRRGTVHGYFGREKPVLFTSNHDVDN